MKPKLWDGPNPVGEAKARFNETLDTPFLTASGPGFTARKMNGFSEVTGELEQQELAGEKYRVFSLGYINGESLLSGSVRGKGAFRKRGVSASGAFSVPNVLYVGGGYGIVPLEESAGVYALMKTYDGKRFKKITSFFSAVDTPTATILSVLHGSMSGVVVTTHTWGVSLYWYDATHYYGVYAYITGRATWAIGATLRYPGFHSSLLHISRIGPSKLIALTAVYRELEVTMAGSVLLDPNPGAAPDSFFQISNDNGATWAAVAVPNLGELADHVIHGGFNVRVGGMAKEFSAFAVTPTLAVGITEFCKHVSYDPYNWELDPVYEYRVYQINSMAVTQVAVLDTAQVSPTKGVFVTDSSSAAPGGVVVCQWRPFYAVDPDTSLPTHHKLAISSNAGVTWLYRELPWVSANTGFIQWVDENTLGCCVYDTEHSWYQSADLGVTWEKRATLRTDAVAPPGDGPYLGQFNIVREFLKKDFTPSVTTPGAPWVSDPSIDYKAP